MTKATESFHLGLPGTTQLLHVLLLLPVSSHVTIWRCAVINDSQINSMTIFLLFFFFLGGGGNISWVLCMSICDKSFFFESL